VLCGVTGSILVLTHDSIRLGEDGRRHPPDGKHAAFAALDPEPLTSGRPCDAVLEHRGGVATGD